MCYSGDYRTCRYLIDDDTLSDTYYCQKLRPAEKQKIDKRVDDFLKDCARKNLDPKQQNIPIGNNCSGYPLLKLVTLGYDVADS